MHETTTNTRLFTILSLGFLAAACSGADPGDSGDLSDDPGSAPVGIEDGADTTVDAAPLSGRVSDSVASRNLADVEVCALGAEVVCASSDAEGYFELEAAFGLDVPVFVSASDYYSTVGKVSLGMGNAWLDVPMVARDAADLGGLLDRSAVLFRVTRLSEMLAVPAEGVQVRVGDLTALYTSAAGGFDDAASATGADGIALVRDVPLGELHVVAEEAFGAGCELIDSGALVQSATLDVQGAAITAVDVYCH